MPLLLNALPQSFRTGGVLVQEKTEHRRSGAPPGIVIRVRPLVFGYERQQPGQGDLHDRVYGPVRGVSESGQLFHGNRVWRRLATDRFCYARSSSLFASASRGGCGLRFRSSCNIPSATALCTHSGHRDGVCRSAESRSGPVRRLSAAAKGYRRPRGYFHRRGGERLVQEDLVELPLAGERFVVYFTSYNATVEDWT